FASVLAACSGPPSDSPGAVTQAESQSGPNECGPRLIGSTCQKADGSCEHPVCSDGNWVCPKGDVEVPLTPHSCAPHPKDCAPRLIGSTCQKADGSCEQLV